MWLDVKVEGADRISFKIREQARQRSEAFLRGCEKAAYFLLGKSQELVPVDTGDLKASGKVVTTGQGHNRQYEIRYDEEYAVFVHEDLTKHHDHGQAKFLEVPYYRYRKYMSEIIRREMGNRTSGK